MTFMSRTIDPATRLFLSGLHVTPTGMGERLGIRWVTTSDGYGYQAGHVRLPADHPWDGMDENDVGVRLPHFEMDISFARRSVDASWWIGFSSRCTTTRYEPDPKPVRGSRIGDDHRSRAPVYRAHNAKAHTFMLCRKVRMARQWDTPATCEAPLAESIRRYAVIHHTAQHLAER